ncbi:hypothetical protein C8R44DRAFT_858706 [Mycena epipterygia]|nr:hypothetical protein C8R44DRAFT_858706 [Mycena epipterygia]
MQQPTPNLVPTTSSGAPPKIPVTNSTLALATAHPGAVSYPSSAGIHAGTPLADYPVTESAFPGEGAAPSQAHEAASARSPAPRVHGSATHEAESARGADTADVPAASGAGARSSRVEEPSPLSPAIPAQDSESIRAADTVPAGADDSGSEDSADDSAVQAGGEGEGDKKARKPKLMQRLKERMHVGGMSAVYLGVKGADKLDGSSSNSKEKRQGARFCQNYWRGQEESRPATRRNDIEQSGKFGLGPRPSTRIALLASSPTAEPNNSNDLLRGAEVAVGESPQSAVQEERLSFRTVMRSS